MLHERGPPRELDLGRAGLVAGLLQDELVGPLRVQRRDQPRRLAEGDPVKRYGAAGRLARHEQESLDRRHVGVAEDVRPLRKRQELVLLLVVAELETDVVPPGREVEKRERRHAPEGPVYEDVGALGLRGEVHPGGTGVGGPRQEAACGKRGGEETFHSQRPPFLAFLMRFSTSTSLALASACRSSCLLGTMSQSIRSSALAVSQSERFIALSARKRWSL